MSHFTVLVPAKNNGELLQKLLPYYEYGCGGFDEEVRPYLVFEVEHKADEFEAKARAIANDDFVQGKPELKTEYEAYLEAGDYTSIFRDWSGGELHEGSWGRWHNPNDKWDWFSVGGRWTGLLRIKPNLIKYLKGDTLETGNGEPGLMTKPNNDPGRCDYTLAGYVDWEGMKQEQFNRAMAQYRTYHQLKAEIAKETVSVQLLERSLEEYRANTPRGENIRKRFGSVEDWAKDRLLTNKLWDHHIHFNTWDEHDRINLPENEYQQLSHLKALTFAFIDLEGKWNERGSMGWFAVVTDENPDYDQAFWKFIETVPDQQRVYVVDCHI
jgi:hypothetical protein